MSDRVRNSYIAGFHWRRTAIAVSLLLLLVFAPGCHSLDREAPPGGAEVHPSSQPAASPAKTGAGHHAPVGLGVACIDVYADGATLHLLTGVKQDLHAPVALQYSKSADGGATWTNAVRVDSGLPAANRAHPGMDARIAAAGKVVLAAWSSAGTGYMDSGPLVLAQSTDGGRTWARVANPADDQSTGGHDFIDMAADSAGIFHIVWLDSRGGRQGLRYAQSADAGQTWSKNVTIDDETCECCWNAISLSPGRQVTVLYRDKNPRDMKFARSTDGGKSWAAPALAGNFNWQFDGCPHTGGGLATTVDASGKPIIHCAVWTGRPDSFGIYYFSIPDAGATSAVPHRLGPQNANHPDLAANADGKLAIVYDAMEDEQAVFALVSNDGGKTWSSPRRLSSHGASAEAARVVVTPAGLRAFWLEKRDGTARMWMSAGL